jgi:hypothetical protein
VVVCAYQGVAVGDGPVEEEAAEVGERMQSSQSRTPMILGRVGWNTRLSILKSPWTMLERCYGWAALSLKKESISAIWGRWPTGFPASASRVLVYADESDSIVVS